MTKVEIELLKACYGDCIFLTVSNDNKEYIIMIDSGTSLTYIQRGRYGRTENGPLKTKLNQLKADGKAIDLLVITHVDDDHIGGVLEWFKDQIPSSDFVKQIWMNDDVEVTIAKGLDNTSAQAASLKKLLDENEIPFVNQIIKGSVFSFEWGRMLALAPTAEKHNKISEDISNELYNTVDDRYDENIKKLLEEKYDCGKCSKENDASMAFLLQTNDGENCLLLGDANIDIVMDSLKHIEGIMLPLKCRWVKLSHHGSKNNFSPELLDMIEAENYIISTNGIKFGHPDKEVIAYLVDKTNAKLWFNYPKRAERLFTKQDRQDYPNLEERIKFFN